jgi:integrase
MLTDQQLKAAILKAKAEARDIAIKDTGKTRGLEFRASYAGTASFAFTYTKDGKRKRFNLGRYRPGFGLSEARQEAERLRIRLRDGVDPVLERDGALAAQRKAEAERKAREEAERSRVTLDQLADEYFAGTDQRDVYRMKYRLNLAPSLGKVIASEIRRSDIQRVVDAVNSRGANVEAHRVFELIRAMLRWGIPRDYVKSEPWKGVTLPKGSEPRERVLTSAEVRWLWEATEQWHGDLNSQRIVRLALLLGQRSGEIAGMERKEVAADLMTWTLPAKRTKNGEAHSIPLPPLARTIIQEALAASPSRTHLFVGERGKPYRSDGMAKVLKRALDAHNDELSEEERIPRFTIHDLRRTVATCMERMGIGMTIIAATLNHISAKQASVTQRHYAHADLNMEIRAALTRWQATVEAILAGADPFETRVEDIHELEQRMLAKGFGGPARLRIVS